MSEFHVFKINTFGSASGSHAINRDEDWVVKLEETFDSKEKAIEFIRNSTKSLPEFVILSHGKSEEEKLEFLDKFLCEDMYLVKNRYFLGMPPIDRIVKHLKLDKIKVVM